MSDNELTEELQRLRLQFKSRWQKWRETISPYLRPKTIRGQLLNHAGEPVPNAAVTLNRFRQTWTDRRGEFSFRLVFRPDYHLTLEWRDLELSNWIHGRLSDRPVTQLRLHFPALIRGQLLDRQEQPIAGVPVFLDQSYSSYTDLHGCFAFPREEEGSLPKPAEEKNTEVKDWEHQLAFRLEGQSFTHALQIESAGDVQLAFLYDNDALFHIMCALRA